MGREADKAGQNNLHKYCFTATSGKLYCGHTVTKYHREAESYKTHIFIKVLMPDWHSFLMIFLFQHTFDDSCQLFKRSYSIYNHPEKNLCLMSSKLVILR